MTDLPEILEAFEKALELEHELGTRAVECDRALLLPSSQTGGSRAIGTIAPPLAAPRAVAPSVAPHAVPSSVPPPSASLSGDAIVPIAPSPSAVAEVTVAALTACRRCGLHALGRQHVVPGQGNAQEPDFMFIGEAPGADEDRQGLAFVGAAGQFLTKMIQAMGYTRDQVFIANICKCRPPNNRTPTPPEMAACVPYLKRQISEVKPKCLILLGRTAMQGLFPQTVMRRGVWYAYEGIPTIATFHPAYILRFDSARDAVGLRQAKVQVWETLKLALAKLGKKPPKR